MEVEGAFVIVGFLSFLIYALTGPVTGFALSRVMRKKVLTLFQYFGLFLLVTLPIIAFQGNEYGVSLFQLAFCGTVTDQNLHRVMLLSTAMALAVYLIVAAISYALAIKAPRWMAVGAIVMFVAFFGVTYFQSQDRFIRIPAGPSGLKPPYDSFNSCTR